MKAQFEHSQHLKIMMAQLRKLSQGGPTSSRNGIPVI